MRIDREKLDALIDSAAEAARTAPPPVSYVVEVIADSSGEWCRNGMRYGTEREAELAGRDLMSRWMLVQEYRTAPTADPVNAIFSREHGSQLIETATSAAEA